MKPEIPPKSPASVFILLGCIALIAGLMRFSSGNPDSGESGGLPSADHGAFHPEKEIQSREVRLSANRNATETTAAETLASNDPGSLGSALAAARHEVEKLDPDGEHSRGADYFAANPGQQLRAWFSRDGVELASGIRCPEGVTPWSTGLRLREIGRAGSMATVSAGSPSARGNRVELDHRDASVIQWFENRGEGLEQGFTLLKRPEGGADEAQLLLELSGNLRAVKTESGEAVSFTDAIGTEVIRYTGLKAWDATGRMLLARMDAGNPHTITLSFSDDGAIYPVTVDPLFANMEARLVQEPVIGDEFGKSVALAGDTALIGAPLDDTAAGIDAGSAYVFTRSANVHAPSGISWNRQTKILPADGAAYAGFGSVVALSPASIVSSNDWQNAPVGLKSVPFALAFKVTPKAPGMNGLVGLSRGDADWFDDLACTLRLSLDGHFDAVNGGAFQRLNPLPYVVGHAYAVVMSVNPAARTYSVTVDGVVIAENFAFRAAYAGPGALDTLVVKNETGSHVVSGIPSDTALIGASGKAYIFERAGTLWSQQAQLASLLSPVDNGFGSSLAISGNTAVAGTNANTAHVFVRDGSAWSKQATLTATGPAGRPVAVLGNTAWIGGSDRVHVFTRSELSWSPQTQVTLTSPATSLALSGNTGLIGQEGSARAFIRSGASWSFQQSLIGSDGSPGNKFGAAVSLSDDTALVGAPENYTTNLAPKGCAYLFARTGTSWAEEKKFVAADGAKYEHLGSAVEVSGTTALVGLYSDFRYWTGPIYEDTSPPGGAYVFERGSGNWNQQVKLKASDGVENDGTGKSVAISGNKALVGAPDSDTSAGINAGRAFVFSRNGNYWDQEANLTAGDGSDGTKFGYSVAIAGTTALVGTPYDEESGTRTGAAYVFESGGNGWNPQAKLLANDRSSNNNFGWSVALSGNTALIGSPGDDIGVGSFAGSAYVFTRGGTVWSQQFKLVAPTSAIGDAFGWSVALSGETAVVGAPAGEAGSVPGGVPGSAHVFTRTGSSWNPQAELTGINNEGGNRFGWSVAISGDTALVGAPFLDFNLPEPSVAPGSAYAFARSGSTWTTEARLVAAGGVTGDVFGYSVAVSGNAAVIGVPFRDSSTNRGGGVAYLFEKNGTLWNEQQTLSAGVDADDEDQFGESVAIAGNLAVVGASRDQTVGANAGGAYTFLLGELPAITSQPVSRTVVPGQSATFGIAATGTGPLRYQWRHDGFWISGATTPGITVTNAQLLDQGNYDCVVSNVGGVVTSAAATLKVNALSEFPRRSPDPPPSSQGFIIVNLTPSGTGGWRFAGEQSWRPSGIPAGALATGDRIIEFMPVNGYIQPPPEPVGIVSGGFPVILTRDYFNTGQTGSATLEIILKPDSIAETTVSEGQRARWRLFKPGVNFDDWLDSEHPLPGLVPGTYLVECKPVPGRATPPPTAVTVEANDTTLHNITYFLENTPTGAAPVVLPFETVVNSTQLPYAHVGQIRGDSGSSTGFVVKPRVVATAGHVVFDDATLAQVTGLQWLFQRDSTSHEPKPQIPRGIILLDDYAAARSTSTAQPGEGTPESQNRDAAALYFLDNAGRLGYSGFLASDATENEFLVSTAPKMLVGYPVDPLAGYTPGRMHATPAATTPFTRVFATDSFGTPYRTYTTLALRGSGGMSGGPLCIQFENGNYYPAAIYLGGSNQTVVRAIDQAVIDIFHQAELLSTSGDNDTGGGITLSSFTSLGNAAQPGALKVTINPPAARVPAAWRLKPEITFRPSGNQHSSLAAGTYIFELATVENFQIPADQTVTIKGGKLTEITFTYKKTVLPPVITSPPSITTTRGQNLTYQITATHAPSSYSLTGSLPAGLDFDPATGLISGLSDQAGVFTLTLGATNDSGTDTLQFTLISRPYLAISPSTTSPLNQPLTLPFTGSESGAGVTYATTGLPPGITLNPATKTLAGTPQLPGTYPATLTVTKSSASTTANFTLTITSSALDLWRQQNFGTTLNTNNAANDADPDHDGSINIDEYAAGTNPNNAADLFKALAITKTGATCTVTAAGKTGRTYVLERRATLVSGTWTTVATTGPLATDASVFLTDSSSPMNSAFYRIRVSAP